MIAYPPNPGPHLDLDFVAMWILSSESVYGSTAYLFNQQLGLYGLVHHSMLLDLTARAFQVITVFHGIIPSCFVLEALCSGASDAREAVGSSLHKLPQCREDALESGSRMQPSSVLAPQ